MRLSHLGDVVHALPVFHALRESLPEAQLAWAIQPEFADLVQGLPGLSRVLLFDRRGGLAAWVRLRRELAQFDADWAIDAQGNLKSAGVMLCSGARRRSGFHRQDWRERLGALVLNETAPPLPRGLHAVDRALHLGRYVARSEELQAPLDWLCLSPEELDQGRREWSSRMPRERNAALILQLSSPTDVRAWPVARQRELLTELSRQQRPTLALSGPAEAGLGAKLAQEFPGVNHWVAQRGLRALAALFTAAAEENAQFIGTDSGPLHLAAACGMRVIGLAGPQDPQLTGPWPTSETSSSQHAIVRAQPPAPCAPCLSRRCSHPDGPICMSAIRAEDVQKHLVPQRPDQGALPLA